MSKTTVSGLRACAARGCHNPTATRNSLKCIDHQTPEPSLLADRVVFRCPECGQVWRASDDPNEWTYGHDCEV